MYKVTNRAFQTGEINQQFVDECLKFPQLAFYSNPDRGIYYNRIQRNIEQAISRNFIMLRVYAGNPYSIIQYDNSQVELTLNPVQTSMLREHLLKNSIVTAGWQEDFSHKYYLLFSNIEHRILVQTMLSNLS